MNTELANSLSDEQKAATLTALKWIGLWVSMDISDSGDLTPSCAERLRINYQLLKFSRSSTLLSKYEDDGAEDLLFRTLNSIPTITKPWFVVETYMMVSVEGNISPRAMQIALMYCEKIGVSEEMYLEIIKEAYVATGDYREGMFDK
ncbi:hypothetical protein [Segetibacter koreensis]|uniref:hypothetical protein n=1 Tax=Segetibacter koreensis TaxID=398037 RepID=UPI00037D55F7|nr:hypothetical protein [Segetibacter koreensis]